MFAFAWCFAGRAAVLDPFLKHLTPCIKSCLKTFLLLAYANQKCLLRNKRTTLSNGYLGSRNDEERSEMRYVMRIAEFSESSNL